MSTTKLNATKWAAQHTAGHDTHGQTAIYDETTGKDVAILYDGDAHAEFIVRAVNSHADMLEALETCIGQIEGAYSSSLEDNEPAWLKDARAAVAKARGIA